MGIMLVYDVTNENSFKNIAKWLQYIEDYGNENVQKMILANKCDMEDIRAVTKDRGEAFARENGFRFMETSAKANINIEQAFLELTESILDWRTLGKDTTKDPDRIILVRRDKKKRPSSKNCCA